MIDANLSLKAYFKDLRAISVLGRKEQYELAIKAQKGDKCALDKLIKSNLRFVVTIAKDYQYSKIPLEDLISEGNIGLIKAIEKFDSKKNDNFILYAVWWIRQAIIQSVYENGSTVRLPINRIYINNKINKSTEYLSKSLERPPTTQEISEYCNICEKDITDSYSDFSGMVDLCTFEGDQNYDNPIDNIGGCDSIETLKMSNNNAASQTICSVLSDLSARESKILKMYFGLENGEEMNLKEIGESLNLTNERVRQIKDLALKKLRSYGKSYKLREFLKCNI